MTPTTRLFAGFLVCTSMQAFAIGGEASPPATQPNPGPDIRVQNLLEKVKRSLRFLKGGTFDMGDWGDGKGHHYDIDPYSRPLHKVTLDSFSMMAYKVTYDDFDVFTDAVGKERIDMDEISSKYRAPNRPAGVSWFGAKEYCQWLGRLTKLPFDLPTEAQWEYSARSGGKRVLFATDNGTINRGKNFPPEWQYGEKEPPLPDVGSYPPNAVGLYGMSENTSEWVQDWFDENYYKISPQNNPSGPLTGIEKVIRGSVSGKAEISAMVFMRAKRPPQPLEATYPNGLTAGEVMVPFPGFSGFRVDNFRCAVNSPKKIN